MELRCVAKSSTKQVNAPTSWQGNRCHDTRATGPCVSTAAKGNAWDSEGRTAADLPPAGAGLTDHRSGTRPSTYSGPRGPKISNRTPSSDSDTNLPFMNSGVHAFYQFFPCLSLSVKTAYNVKYQNVTCFFLREGLESRPHIFPPSLRTFLNVLVLGAEFLKMRAGL